MVLEVNDLIKGNSYSVIEATEALVRQNECWAELWYLIYIDAAGMTLKHSSKV